jgi:hypothetical protein
MSSARCLPTPVTAIDPVATTTAAMVTRASQQLPFVLTLPNLSSVVPAPLDLQAAVLPLLPIEISGMPTGTPTPVEFVVDPGFQFRGIRLKSCHSQFHDTCFEASKTNTKLFLVNLKKNRFLAGCTKMNRCGGICFSNHHMS